MKKIYSIILIICCFLLVKLPVFATEAVEDALPNINSWVTITNGQINKRMVQSGDTLKYKFTITDVGIDEQDEDGDFRYGIGYVNIIWRSSKKQKFERLYKWKANKKSMTISGKIKIMDGMQPGEWTIEEIQILSGVGEDAGGIIHVHDVCNRKNYKDWDYFDYIDLSFANFCVKKKRGTKVDQKAPSLDVKSLDVSKTNVKANEKFTFCVKVKDKSKIEFVKCAWTALSVFDGQNIEKTSVYKMKYNKKKKCYQCILNLTRNEQKTEPEFIHVKDIYGNETYYTVDGNSTYYSLPNGRGRKKYDRAFTKTVVYRKQ